MQAHTQVLVIGGGPAGSTAASLLTREGIDVTLVEKEVFPRYHIGESLLPICLDIFDILGIREKIEKCGFQKKHGTYFEWGNEQWEVNFVDNRDCDTYSFQVDRAHFDQLLLDHARSLGVKVHEGVAIRDITFNGERPCKAVWSQGARGHEGATGEISFDYLIDASGRAGIMAMRYLKSRCYNQGFQNVAIWGYWEEAVGLAAGPVGATVVTSVPDGWFWSIPLQGERLSIGLVMHKTAFQARKKQHATLEHLYLEAIRACPLMAQRTGPGKLVSALRVEQDYSYTSECFAGPGYFIAGDAACFLDPLLSTGIHLATYSALLASACITSLCRREIAEDEAEQFYSHNYQRAYLRFVVLVSSLYQQYNGKTSYFWEAQHLSRYDYQPTDLQRAFTSIISGLEDVKDAEHAVSDVILQETAKAYAQCLSLIQQRQPLNWETLTDVEQEQLMGQLHYLATLYERPALDCSSTEGLSIQLQPHLGLTREATVPL